MSPPNPDVSVGDLLDGLLRGPKAARKSALAQLVDAPTDVSDAVAEGLADAVQHGGPNAHTVGSLLARSDAPRFGPRAHQVLLMAMISAQAAEALAPEIQMGLFGKWAEHGIDPNYGRKRAIERGPGLLTRVASVFTRAWVLAFGLLLVIFAASLLFAGQWTVALGTLAAFSATVVLVDARLRRCPKCKTWLGGQLLAIEDDGVYDQRVSENGIVHEYNRHRRSWRCASCHHEWTVGS